MKANRQMRNHNDTLIAKKVFKEDTKIDIDITKEEYGIINNIHGMGNQKTIIQHDITRDQQLQQIREATTTTHGIKGKKIMQ
jgi:hypothetical protein